MTVKGALAAGHPETAKAAGIILDAGGNAFDAILAGMCAACVVEPVLASFGGGGFLLVHKANAKPGIYDFFTQTPITRQPDADFYPIIADFGTTTQEFHIGRGATGTPGVIKGLFNAHRDLGRMPMTEIIEPARQLAKQGVKTNALQSYLFDVVSAIYSASQPSRDLFKSQSDPQKLLREGEIYRNPEMAEFLYVLAREGDRLFYEGEVARLIDQDSKDNGGHLRYDDLKKYQVIKRHPLRVDYGGSHFYTNPPPSSGGILIAFALELLKTAELSKCQFKSFEHLSRLCNVMALTNQARIDAALHEAASHDEAMAMLDPKFLETYRQQVLGHPKALRGTTHLSVIDAKGNAASLTLSNGEGCGHLLPQTGIMMNNMLGEEDINPHGFNQWPENTRMSSMMAPTLLLRDDGSTVALGSGGSNRIRTAILQVLINLLDFNVDLQTAVEAPRIHFERDQLDIESGFDGQVSEGLQKLIESSNVWPDRSLFFGGVHAALFDKKRNYFDGAGDPRRGGSALVI